jgi:hypothetical protein
MLIGSWQYEGMKVDGKYIPDTLHNDYQVESYYANHIFQSRDSFQYADSIGLLHISLQQNIEEGKWKIVGANNRLEHSHMHEIPDSQKSSFTYGGPIFIFYIDDTLLITTNDNDNPIHFYYKKISPLPQVPYSKEIPNDSHVTLVNSADTTRKIKIINGNGALEVNSIIWTTDSLRKITTWYAGEPASLTDSTLEINCTQENIHTYEKKENLNSGETDMSYVGFDVPHRSINLNSINFVKYSNPRKNTWLGIGIGLAFVASLTTLAVAPLIGINYSRGGAFNSKSYFTWTKIGLCGFAVSLPLMAFNSPKQYFITQKNLMRNKNYWYLEKS